MIGIYDDACHLDSRIESLMGLGWEFACLACMDHVTEILHFVGHIDPDCVAQTNWRKRPHLLKGGGTNSPVAEQRFSEVNKVHKMTFQKNGGRFRAFYILLLDDMNVRNVGKTKKQRAYASAR